MTLEDAESILGQVLEHPGLSLSYANHLIAREALRTLADAARKKKGTGEQPNPDKP